MPGIARVLVVANRTADSEELLAALVERKKQGDISVTLVAPARWEEAVHNGQQAALKHLQFATGRLREAGIEAEALVGNADPFTAVEQIWDPKRFDEVIVATLPEHLSHWLRLDLTSRVERLIGRPVQHVIGHERVPT